MTSDSAQPRAEADGARGSQPRALALTVSDRRSTGAAADTTGPVIAAHLCEHGFSVRAEIVADGRESVARALRRAAVAGTQVVVTTGGTGLGPRDHTPEGTSDVLTRLVPGIAESIRRRGYDSTIYAGLSRGMCGIVDSSHRGAMFVVNLPGSGGGVRDGLEVLGPLWGHIVQQLIGGDH